MRFLWNQTESKVKDKDLIPIFGTHGTLMKIITLHLLVIVGEGRNADPRGVCGSAAVKVIQKMQSGDRDS